MTNVDGLITGLDTTSIIDQLLAAERLPQDRLVAQKLVAEAKADTFAELRSRYDGVRTAAQKLDLPDDWARLAATSSSDLVKVSADTGSITGSVRFTVVQRARAHSVYSTDILTSLDDLVTAGGAGEFTASGYEPLGFSGLTGAGLAEGVQTFEVTQASAAATKTATAALPDGIQINGANDKIDLDVNGTGYTLSIDKTTYATREDLRAAIQAAIDAQGLAGELSAQLDGADQLELVTTREGSDATIRVTGGNALADLGLTVDASAITGVDGTVTVNGIDTVVTNTDAGTQVVLDAGTGTITGTLSGGLRLGTADVEQTSGSPQTLQEFVEWVNTNDSLTTKAAIIQVDEGQYRLQLTAGETGDDSAIDLDLGILTLPSGFTTLTTGQDAQLRVEGDNPFTVNSSSDTFTDLMPGLDVTLAGVPAEEVVVDLTRDSGAIADDVQALVDAVNSVLTGFDEVSDYDADANEAALLTGNSTVRRARDELTSALIGAVAGASLGSVGLTGLTITNDGTFEFDRATFLAAYEDDPDAVERVYAVPFDSSDEATISRVLAEIDDATAFGTGYLRSAEDAENARVDDLDDSISAWDRRLEIREQVLRNTYIRLETALAALQTQSTWLAGQIATLTTPNTDN